MIHSNGKPVSHRAEESDIGGNVIIMKHYISIALRLAGQAPFLTVSRVRRRSRDPTVQHLSDVLFFI
jgi:hypothetical protein